MNDWWCVIICCLIDDHSNRSRHKKKDRLEKHSRYRKDFFRSLDRVHRQLRQRKIPRCSLQDQSSSAWRRLYDSRNDQGMITLTGFDHAAFDFLCGIFAPVFDSYTQFVPPGTSCFERTKQPKKGRPRMIRPEDCLGLVLVWTRTRGPLNVLQLVFGLTYTNLLVYLRFGIRLFVETFRHDPLASVSIPSAETIETFQDAFAVRHPLLNDCWATMDGLKLYLQQSGNAVIQERYYNGWTHDHYVTSVFCFCPDGTIPIAFFNVPGSVHDSQVAEFGNIYNRLEEVYLSTGAKCCIDSAFGNVTREYLYKSCQDLLGSNAPTRQERLLDLQKKRQATSARQTAEWGMLTLQASFPRLKDRFVYEERGERRITLKMLVLIYNMRARMVGINQILNTYVPRLMWDANEDVNF